MLYVDIDLPAGALLDAARSEPSKTQPNLAAIPFSETGAIHFSGADLVEVDGVISQWLDTTGGRIARAAKPNAGNARVDSLGGRPGLSLRDRINCGFTVEDIVVESPVFSMAVLVASPVGRAGTLLTLNPKDDRNYLFLAETENGMVLEYRDGNSGVTMPAAPTEGHMLIAASVNGEALRVALNGGDPVAGRAETALTPGGFDLFIGCRSDRSGILKTLGEAHIAEVWLWPDRDLFADGTWAALPAAWRSGGSHGF